MVEEAHGVAIEPLLEAARAAGDRILEIYARDFEIEYKGDDSPLTEADKASNEVIMEFLRSAHAETPIISEENREVAYEERKDWARFWLVDPLDGTKEFIKKNGEFTVNIVTVETLEAMNATAATIPADEDEFDHGGVTKLESVEITPCRVAEAVATMECRVVDIVHVGREGGGNHLVIGEAVMLHVAERVLDGTRIDQGELRAVGRHAGNWYSNATDLFTIERPA